MSDKYLNENSLLNTLDKLIHVVLISINIFS